MAKDLQNKQIRLSSCLPFLQASIPFAVVGSNTVVEAPGGKKIRGRMYPWGIVEGNVKIRGQLFKINNVIR